MRCPCMMFVQETAVIGGSQGKLRWLVKFGEKRLDKKNNFMQNYLRLVEFAWIVGIATSEFPRNSFFFFKIHNHSVFDACNKFQKRQDHVHQCDTKTFLLTTLWQLRTIIVKVVKVKFPHIRPQLIHGPVCSLLSYFVLHNAPHIFNGRQVWTAGRSV